MDVVARYTRDDDLDACSALLVERSFYTPEDLKALRGMWGQVLGESSYSHVAVIANDPGHVVAFGIFVFVSNEQADAYFAMTEPLIGRQLARDFAAGRVRFLNGHEIGVANAGDGLNMIAPYQAYEHHGDRDWDTRLRFVLSEAATRRNLGLNLRSVFCELYGRSPVDVEMLTGYGFRVCEYTRDALRCVGLDCENGPLVAMATREDARQNRGSYLLGQIFRTFVPPRVGFSAEEQCLLRLALDGRTDEEISKTLSISSSITKKRFRAIYEKALDASATDFDASPRCDGHRGHEMRRHLLNYLREHPEELHPFSAPQRE